jgi:ribosomal protein S18 acetylase RimI-like enzyme
VNDIDIRAAAFADPEVQQLVKEALADLGRRYGSSGDDTPVAPTDFDPPAGAFFVAVDGDDLVGCCDRQPEAIGLYRSAGYERIEDFGYYRDYAGVCSYARVL